jgi:hypothetical protein
MIKKIIYYYQNTEVTVYLHDRMMMHDVSLLPSYVALQHDDSLLVNSVVCVRYNACTYFLGFITDYILNSVLGICGECIVS